MKKWKLAMTAVMASAALVGCSKGATTTTTTETVQLVDGKSQAEASAEKSEDEHVDEFSMVEAHAEPANESGVYDIVVTARNDTDETLKFWGLIMNSLDADGNIIDSYRTTQRNSIETEVEPGQSISIPLTFNVSDGVKGVRCTGYLYGESYPELIEGKFSEFFTQMF